MAGAKRRQGILIVGHNHPAFLNNLSFSGQKMLNNKHSKGLEMRKE